jgi:hypothetical protein
MIKTVLGTIFFVFGFLLFTCSSPDSSPPPPTAPDCETNHTADVTFENRSTNNIAYDIYWDGKILCVLSPGTKSITYKMSYGTHKYEFVYTNTFIPMCATTTVNLVQCQTYLYYCTY